MTDIASTLNINISLILPEIILVSAASLILLVSFHRKGNAIAIMVAALGLAAAMVVASAQWNAPGTAFSGMVTIDKFGVMFKMLFCLGSLISLLIAYRYFQVKGLERPEFYALLLFSTMGMMVMATTTDLIVMFLGLEIMSVPLYVMAGFNRQSAQSNEAGIKYFIMGAFATAFLLLGIAFIYGASKTTDLRVLVTDYAYFASQSAGYLYAGVGLVLIGFGFKVAAVPFHAWVPDVYQGAPTPVTAFFSVGPKAAGIAVMLRIFIYGFGEMPSLSTVFWILAVLTMTVGNILAVRQDNIKRMLAYSSIAHAGYILVGLAAGGSEAVSAAIFYLVGYTMFNLGAFAVLTVLEMRRGCTCEFSELQGLGKTNPVLAVLLALFMFALTGFPPTVGFFGKLYIFSAAVEAGLIGLVVIGVLNSFVSVYYYLRVIKTSFFDDASGATAPATLSPAIMAAIIITAIGTLLLGIFPGQLLDFSRAALFGEM
jgi:NADH-quinone oxidoreductase subunit N